MDNQKRINKLIKDIAVINDKIKKYSQWLKEYKTAAIIETHPNDLIENSIDSLESMLSTLRMDKIGLITHLSILSSCPDF